MAREDDILKSELMYDALTSVAGKRGRQEPAGPVANPPVITSGAAFNFAENTDNNTLVFTVTATGGDGPLDYSIEGGDDAALLSIDNSNGEVFFLASPDFETPLDADTDNVYEIIVGVSDGVNPVVTQAVEITVLDIGLLAGEQDGHFGYSSADSFGVLEPVELGEWTIHQLSCELVEPVEESTFVVVMTPNFISQAGWTSVALEGPGVSMTILSADATSYFEDIFAGGIGNATMWIFEGTVVPFQSGEVYSVTWVVPPELGLIRLLNYFDGVDGATAMPDEIPGVTWSEVDNGALVANQLDSDNAPQFGTTSLKFTVDDNGNNQIAEGIVLAGETVITIEGWWQANNVSQSGMQVNLKQATDDLVRVSIELNTEIDGASSSLFLGSLADTTVASEFSSDSPGIGGGNWYHWALVVDATGTRLYFHGEKILERLAGDYDEPWVAFLDEPHRLELIPQGLINQQQWHDEIRVSIVARYHGDLYDAPAEQFPADDDIPTFTSPSVFPFDENTVGTAFTVIAVGGLDTLVYSIEGGVDAAFFDIDSGTGEVTFLSPPDFEDPQDDNIDNAYEVTIGVTDGISAVVTQDVVVEVANVLEGFQFLRLNVTGWLNAGTPNTGDIRILDLELIDGTKYPIDRMTADNAPSPLVATSSSELSSSFEPWHAFDWLEDRFITSTPVGGVHWLQIDFGDGNGIQPTQYAFAGDDLAAANYFCTAWTLAGSDTGSFAGEETVLDTRSGVTTGWGGYRLRYFDVTGAPATYRYLRLTVTGWVNAGVPDTGDIRISELRFYAGGVGVLPNVPMTAVDTPSPLVASAASENGSFPVWKAFDKIYSDAGGRFIAGSPVGGEHWVQIDLGDGNALLPTSYSIAPDSVGGSGYHLTEWQLLGSNTGDFSGEETLIASETGITTGWAALLPRYFSV